MYFLSHGIVRCKSHPVSSNLLFVLLFLKIIFTVYLFFRYQFIEAQVCVRGVITKRSL